MIRKLALLFCVFTFVVAGSVLAQTPKKGGAVAPKKTETLAPKKGGILVIARGGDSVGLDPAYETDGLSFNVCENIMECLVFFKDESTAIEPGLAQSWQISPDSKTYTFKLRKGVKFHDGTPFNADAVVFSIGRQMKERNLKFFGNPLEIPKQDRPPEYWLQMEMDKTVESIEAKDEYTVVFKLRRVEAPFLANLGMQFMEILSPTAFLKDPAGFVKNPVGTGPYKFVKWVKDDSVTLEPNKDYWDKAKGPYLDKVVFRTIPDNSVRFLELKTGNINICQFPNAADVALAKKDANLKVPTQPGFNVGYLSFNHTKEPWKTNAKLRKAIAHAINRKAIVDNLYQGMGEVAKNPVPPTIWCYDKSIPGYGYNPGLAKKLLAEAGFPEGKGLPEVNLWCMSAARPYNPDGMKVGEAMQGDLAKVGIKVKLVTFDWGTYLKKQREQPPEMDLFQLGWTGDNGDPDNFLAVLFDGIADPTVRTQWHSEKYHKFMQDGKQTTDQKKRVKIYQSALKFMFNECPVIPIAHSLVVWPTTKNVNNFKLHPLGHMRLKSIWLE